MAAEVQEMNKALQETRDQAAAKKERDCKSRI